jgi:hypothetical protein
MTANLRQEEHLIDYENLELDENIGVNLLGTNSIGSNLTGQSHYGNITLGGLHSLDQNDQR